MELDEFEAWLGRQGLSGEAVRRKRELAAEILARSVPGDAVDTALEAVISASSPLAPSRERELREVGAQLAAFRLGVGATPRFQVSAGEPPRRLGDVLDWRILMLAAIFVAAYCVRTYQP